MFGKKNQCIMLASMLILAGLALGGCGQSAQVNITTASAEASDGLDLQALGAIVQKVQNAEDLEKEINKPDGINNLDLDEDGKVDYIKVSSYGEGNYRGFSFAVEFPTGETQHIAEIEIQSDGQAADMQIAGNENIYGAGACYNSHLSLGDAIILSWLFSPGYHHYASPFGYGRYPGYYAPAVVRPMSAYRNTVRNTTGSVKTVTTRTVTSKITKPANAASPYKGKVAEKSVRASLKNPTASQKSFSVTNKSKGIGSGGFGRNNKPAASQAPRSSQKSSTIKSAPRASAPKASSSSRSSRSSRRR